MQAEHLLGLLVRGTLAHLAPKFDAPGPSRCQAGLDPIADQVALELRQARHDGAHQFAARGAEVEAEARLSQDANFPAVQVVERLNEVLRAAAPQAEVRRLRELLEPTKVDIAERKAKHGQMKLK